VLQRQPKSQRRSRSVPRTRPNNENRAKSGVPGVVPPPNHRSPLPAAKEQSRRPHDDSSMSLQEDDGLYENSDDDGLDDVIADTGHVIAERRTRLVASAREVRRWKVVGESAGAPRLKRRPKATVDETVTSLVPTTGRKSRPVGGSSSSAYRRSKRETPHDLKTLISTGSTNVSTNRPTVEPEVNSSEYIYSDQLVGKDDDRKGDTLDRSIPVYDAFKSATLSEKMTCSSSSSATPVRTTLSRVCSDSYVELEQREGDNADGGIYDCEQSVSECRPAETNQQCQPAPMNMPNLDRSSAVRTSGCFDVEEFPCPVCDEPVRVLPISEEGGADGGRSYGVACPFVSAMAELVQLQTVDARPCSSCNNNTATNAIARCLHCRLDLCTACRDTHRRLRHLETQPGGKHLVVNVGDLQSGRYQRELIRSGLSAAPCRRHPSRPAVGHCTSCDVAVCSECRMSDVVGCRQGGRIDTDHLVMAAESPELTEAADRERDLVCSTLLVDVDRRAAQFRADGDAIAAYRRYVETGRREALSAVTDQVDRLH